MAEEDIPATNSGALMDLSMDVAVSLEEIRFHKPDISRTALIKSGLVVGRSVLGTMTTTLMLAYSGNYLSMLMYFAGQGTSLMDGINFKYVASQLLNTLVGSFGMIAAAPLTALIGGVFLTRKAARMRQRQHKATVCQLLSRGDEWRCVHFIGISRRNSADVRRRCPEYRKFPTDDSADWCH